MNLIKHIRSGLLVGIAMTSLSGMANAVPWFETGDAGELLNTAQVTTGTGPLTSISGTIATPADVDLYRISIVNTAAFAVTVATNFGVGPASLFDDSQLFLFNASGFLVLEDDDDGFLFRPQFNPGELAGSLPGTYFIALSLFDTDPIVNPLSGWVQDPFPDQSGTYTLNLAGATFAVPEPGSLALLGVGLMLLAGRRAVSRRL
jgi:hypothetical protein